MVRVVRVELTASAFVERRSVQLSFTRMASSQGIEPCSFPLTGERSPLSFDDTLVRGTGLEPVMNCVLSAARMPIPPTPHTC